MRHGGHERRVSASASCPWPKQVVAMKMKRSVSETAAGGATQVAQLRLLKPTARKKSPCCECLRRKRDNFRPACRKWLKKGDFCGTGRVLYRFGQTSICAGRVLYRLGWTACVPGEFCTGLSMPACVPGEFCTGSDRPACVQGEFCPGWSPKGATGEVLRGQGRRPHRSQVLPYQARWQCPARRPEPPASSLSPGR